MLYEILCIENGIYYIKAYGDGMFAVTIKLTKEEFLVWSKGKLER